MKIHPLFRSAMFGGLTDQAIVSFGNFALGIYLARKLPTAGYGAFSYTLSVILFLNAIHQAFVIYPLSVDGASAPPRDFRFLRTSAAIATIAGSAFLASLLAAALGSVGLSDLIPVAAITMLVWQLQEVFRRGALAHARFGLAVVSDLIRYFGVLILVIAGASLILPSPPFVFSVIAAMSLAASGGVIPDALQNSWGHWRDAAPVLLQRLHRTAPVIGANLLSAFSNQWFLWVLAWTHGLSSSGTLVALANLAAVSSPVTYGIENILVPEVARNRERQSFGAMVKFLIYRGSAAALVVWPFLLAIAIWPQTAVRLFYGQGADYAYFASGLRLLAPAYALFLCSAVTGAVLRAYDATRGVLMMQLWPAILGLVVGTVLVQEAGVYGACAAALLTALARVGVAVYFVIQIRELTMKNATGIVALQT